MELVRPLMRCSSFIYLSQRALGSSVQCMQHHKVIVVGGGTGGAAVASRLCAKLDSADVAVVEPSEVHYYQALWTLVGAGIKPFKDSMKSTSSVLPPKAKLIQDKVKSFQPESSSLMLETGKQLTYEHLVLSLGIELRYDLIPGTINALDSDPRVISNYSPKYVEKSFQAYQNFKGGRAIFTLPIGPIKCAGAPQKAMYLFEDHLKRTDRRNTADIHYFTSLAKMFSVDKYAERLAEICRSRNIHCHLQHHLVEVNSAKSEVTMENLSTKERQVLQYDLLHVVPPMTVPAVLKTAPKLTNGDFVDVSNETLQHKHYANIWALGDCSSLPTSKTAAAVSTQMDVLCKNLCSVLNGGPANVAIYNGYTACPLVTGYDRAIFAEFDYQLVPMETFPFDQGKESRFLYFIKAEVLPPLYWDWLLRGLWSGPKFYRRLLHLGFSK